MNMENKIKSTLTDFEKALKRLEDALHEPATKGDIRVDGTIQRFEFTFELSWKLLSRILNFQGVEAKSPRSAIKEAFQLGLIKKGESWIDMLEDRNKTSHIYDEEVAFSIYQKIKNQHYGLFAQLLVEVQSQ